MVSGVMNILYVDIAKLSCCILKEQTSCGEKELNEAMFIVVFSHPAVFVAFLFQFSFMAVVVLIVYDWLCKLMVAPLKEVAKVEQRATT